MAETAGGHASEFPETAKSDHMGSTVWLGVWVSGGGEADREVEFSGCMGHMGHIRQSSQNLALAVLCVGLWVSRGGEVDRKAKKHPPP